MASFLSFRDLCLLLAASAGVRDEFSTPRVPDELLRPVPGGLHIRRELGLNKLIELARRRSPGAVAEILARLRCEEEHDYLRCWALQFLLPLAEPGEGWAVDACILILQLGGNRSRALALHGARRLTARGAGRRFLHAVLESLSADDPRNKAQHHDQVIFNAWRLLENLLPQSDDDDLRSGAQELLAAHLKGPGQRDSKEPGGDAPGPQLLLLEAARPPPETLAAALTAARQRRLTLDGRQTRALLAVSRP